MEITADSAAAIAAADRRDPADDSLRVRSHVASAGLSWRITDGLGLSAGYSWEQNQAKGFSQIRGGRATASLSYGVDWR